MKVQQNSELEKLLSEISNYAYCDDFCFDYVTHLTDTLTAYADPEKVTAEAIAEAVEVQGRLIRFLFNLKDKFRAYDKVTKEA